MSQELLFKREVHVCVSAQAQKILSHSGYTPEEFLAWCEESRKFSFGGELAAMFLEKMPKKGDAP